MNNKLITIVITLVVGIILAGSVLMPVLNDATKTTKTFTNEGLYRMAALESTDSADIEIKWEYTNPNQITVGDSAVALPTSGFATVVCGENWLVRYIAATGVSVQLFDGTTPGYIASVSGTNDMTITASSGSVTFDNGSGTEVTSTYTTMYYADNNGEYTMIKANEKTVYLNDDSKIIGAGRTDNVFGTSSLTATFAGTIADGIAITPIGSVPSGYTVGDITVSDSAVNGYINLYDFDKFEFVVTAADSSTVTVTYTQVIVPYQVTAELSEHLTSGQIALLSAIPVLVIVALLVVAVGVVARRND